MRGRLREKTHSLHPPWSASVFIEQCQRCDDCIRACPENILLRGDGGYPQIDFSRNACTFCKACVEACRYEALDGQLPQPWSLRALVNVHCLSAKGIVCRACGDSCEQRAIRFQLQTGGRSTPVINNNSCNGCGACIGVCPANAIQMEEAA